MSTDVSRLPKWAQNRIAKLEADLEYERARLGASPESDTFADPFNEIPRPLGVEPTVRFVVNADTRQYIDASLRDGALEVRGSYGLSVEPRAANVCVVREVRP